jgi:predicted patatin/cPLA2 family phospholipase
MTGLIDVGGGMRDIYGAGVVDQCLADGVKFDRVYGISAGSANIMQYMSGQMGRNFRFYAIYAFRPEYMSFKNFLREGSYIDLDYIYSALSDSDGEDPLDYDAVVRAGIPFTIVATDAETGKPAYFTQSDVSRDNYDAVKASCCVPFFNKPYPFKDSAYFDGGMSDPIPVLRALRDGCDKVVVVLTRPKNFYRKDSMDLRIAFAMRKKYPNAAKAMAYRSRVYNRQLDLAKKYEKAGKVLIVAPDSIDGMSTLKKDRGAMVDLYHKGVNDGKAIRQFLGEGMI